MKPIVRIEQPCAENWETMKIGLNARFCDNCQKSVIDFTQKDRKEILQYLLARQNQRICGRIHSSQLDFTHSDFLVSISALTKKHKDTNLPFYLLAIGSLVLMSYSPNTESANRKEMNPRMVLQDTTLSKLNCVQPTDSIPKQEKKVGAEELLDIPLTGDISIGPDASLGLTEPYHIVEIMPEFVGGYDSLANFIKQNLKYPEWEKEQKIQGRLYVSFIVDRNGEIKEPNVVKTVVGAKNFDKEVIRMIKLMPNWIPGKHEGKNVAVRFVLPIQFKL